MPLRLARAPGAGLRLHAGPGGALRGPRLGLLDRIDLHLRLPPVAGRAGRAAGEASAAVRERVLACRGRQLERQDKPNAALAGAELDRHCALDESGRELLLQAMRRLRGSARVLHRTLRVARTIADLEGAEQLGARHVAQAVQYRAE